jgi:hypothetical protein
MIKSAILLAKLRLDKKEFITADELKRYCMSMQLNYEKTVRYFLRREYLVRIFRGVFYVRSLEEAKFKQSKYSHLELVAKGLELKDVKNWYFGLYTALKLNNMTHETFVVDYVINDKLFRSKPINIAGYKYRFLRFSPKLLPFGVVEDNLRYSNAEKTILDFIYLWRHGGIPNEKILLDISEWAKNTSAKRIREYAARYPKTIQEIANEVVR